MEFLYIIISIFAIYGFYVAIRQQILFMIDKKKFRMEEIEFTLNLKEGNDQLEGAVRWFFRNNGHRNGINVKLLIMEEQLTEEAKIIANKISEEYGDVIRYGKH